MAVVVSKLGPKSVCLLWALLCILCVLPAVGLPVCDSESSQVKNAPQSIGNDTVYYNCGFPNPRVSPAQCGRRKPSMICDPSGVLTEGQANEIHDLLEAFYNNTPCDCGACKERPHGSPLWVAVVKHLAITDMSGSLCVYGPCNDVYPKLNPSGRNPTDSESESSIKDFGKQRLSEWKRDSDCSTDVVIVYEATHKTMYIAYREVRHRYLTSEIVWQIYTRAKPMFASGDVTGGLKSMISDVQAKFVPPGVSKTLIIQVTIGVVFGTVALIAIVAGFIYCWRKGKTTGQGCAGGCSSYWAEKGGIFSWNVFCCNVKEEREPPSNRDTSLCT